MLRSREAPVVRVMPYSQADLDAAEAWLDASGVGDDLGDDADAVLESLAEAFALRVVEAIGP